MENKAIDVYPMRQELGLTTMTLAEGLTKTFRPAR